MFSMKRGGCDPMNFLDIEKHQHLIQKEFVKFDSNWMVLNKKNRNSGKV
jgi:hypothetical protein